MKKEGEIRKYKRTSSGVWERISIKIRRQEKLEMVKKRDFKQKKLLEVYSKDVK